MPLTASNKRIVVVSQQGRLIIIIKGANFCHLIINIRGFHLIAEITGVSQKWKGAAPSFSIKLNNTKIGEAGLVLIAPAKRAKDPAD